MNGRLQFKPVAVFFYFIISMLLSNNIFGQFHKASILKPTLTIGYEKIPEQELVDTAGKFGYDAILFSFKIPLYTHMNKASKAGSFGFSAIILNTGGSYTWPGFTYLSARQQLINGHAGLNGIYYGGKKSMYLLGFNTLLAEDNYSINKPHLRYSGSIIRIQKVSKAFSFTVGIAYSFIFGAGLPLPVLGGQVKLGKRSSFNFTLPFNISYSYRFGEQNRLSVFIRPAGGMNNISNRGQFAGYPEIIQLRQRVFQLGASSAFVIWKGIRLIPEAGITNKRKLTFAEPGNSQSDSYFMMQSGAGFYFKLALNFRFGEKPYHGDNDAVNYLMDNGIEDLPSDADEKLNFQ